MVLGLGTGLFFYWLNPWLKGVRAMTSSEVLVPGMDVTDADGDGLTLDEETRLGTRDDRLDTDGDGLEDNEELFFNTNPLLSDTDYDGYNDGLEIETHHDPLK